MKTLRILLPVLALFLFMGSCTNDEGGEDLDVLVPHDSTQSVQQADDNPLNL